MENLISGLSQLQLTDEETVLSQQLKFLETIPNNFQKIILRNIFYRELTHRIYLVDLEQPSEDTLIIKVLGGLNKKGKRESYDVTLKNNSFKCTCKDFIFNSKKRDTVCKHISFIVCKVAVIMDLEFFNTKSLTQEQLQKLQQTLQSSSIWKNNNISLKYINAMFKESKRETVQDVCPICYDDMTEKLLYCPTCHHGLHETCMKVWLETHKTCVMCRSDVWKEFKSL